MSLHVERVFQDGAWRYVVVDESGGGGSLPDPAGEPDGSALVVQDGAWVVGEGGGGGGSSPVSAQLQVRDTRIDIHDAGAHPLLWDYAVDNPWDFNQLLALPAGLGIAAAIDGSSATITTTEAGTWAFTLSATFSDDATFEGNLVLDGNAVAAAAYPGSAPFPNTANVSEVVTYPAGASFDPAINTFVAATDPLEAGASLLIVRLA